MDNLPSRRETPRRQHMPRTLLDRIDKLTARTGLLISAPYNNLSGLWEVSDGKGTAQWDNGRRMIDDLEMRYPE